MTAQPQNHRNRQPFTPLTDSEFFFFTRLGREDLLAAYIELKRHCWTGKNLCWPSAERQAAETGRKVATVRRRLEDLEKLGVIRVLRASASKCRGNRYILTQQDEWQTPGDRQHENSDRPRSFNPDREQIPDPDRRRSSKQIDPRKPDREETNNQVSIAPAAGRRKCGADSKPATRDVIVPSEISSQVLERLKSMGAPITPSLVSTISRSDSQALEHALACLEAARNVENPPGYFLAALKGNWSPPASLVVTRERKQAEIESRRRQARIDELARIWGYRVGMDWDALIGDIGRDVGRSQRPPVERVQEWVELGRSQEKATAIESDHDRRVRAAFAVTITANLAELLVGAGLFLGSDQS